MNNRYYPSDWIDRIKVLFAVNERGHNLFLTILDCQRYEKYNYKMNGGFLLEDNGFVKTPTGLDIGMYIAEADVVYYKEPQTNDYPGYEEITFVIDDNSIEEYYSDKQVEENILELKKTS